MSAAAAPAAPDPGVWLPVRELLNLDDAHGSPSLGAFDRVAAALTRPPSAPPPIPGPADDRRR